MKILGWIIALFGLWEFADIAAPFVPGFGEVPAFLWNHIIAGMILVIVGVWAARTKNRRTARILSGVAAAAGIWLVVAALVLGSTVSAVGRWNDIIVGGIVTILGMWGLVLSRNKP